MEMNLTPVELLVLVRGNQVEKVEKVESTCECDATSMTLVQVTGLCDVLNSGNKINAIKFIRQCTSIGLKEAKDVVEGCYVQR
jgi:ribosomal protein L7/L12